MFAGGTQSECVPDTRGTGFGYGKYLPNMPTIRRKKNASCLQFFVFDLS